MAIGTLYSISSLVSFYKCFGIQTFYMALLRNSTNKMVIKTFVWMRSAYSFRESTTSIIEELSILRHHIVKKSEAAWTLNEQIKMNVPYSKRSSILVWVNSILQSTTPMGRKLLISSLPLNLVDRTGGKPYLQNMVQTECINIVFCLHQWNLRIHFHPCHTHFHS